MSCLMAGTTMTKGRDNPRRLTELTQPHLMIIQMPVSGANQYSLVDLFFKYLRGYRQWRLEHRRMGSFRATSGERLTESRTSERMLPVKSIALIAGELSMLTHRKDCFDRKRRHQCWYHRRVPPQDPERS